MDTSKVRARPSDALRDQRILVVEREYYIAEDIADVLAAAGAVVVGPTRDTQSARGLMETETAINAALVEVRPEDECVWPTVDALLMRDTPVLLHISQSLETIPSGRRTLPLHSRFQDTQSLVLRLALLIREAS